MDGCTRSADRERRGRAGLCNYHYVRRSTESYEHYLTVNRIKNRRWNLNNPEKRKLMHRKWRKTHRLQDNKKCLEWRHKNIEKDRASGRRYYWKHKERIRIKQKSDRLQQKLTVFNHYTQNSLRCMCDCQCQEKNITMLTVDHINSDGYLERRKQARADYYSSIIRKGFPPTYQILCWNCNIGRAHNGGICPRIP